MPKGKPNKRYTPAFKKMVIETMLEEKLSYSETARRFEVCNHHRIQSWERIYLTEGAEGFELERRGRGSKGRPRQLPKNGEEVRVKAEGKSTHAMSPEKGMNAIGMMLQAFSELPCTLSIGDFVETYCKTIGMTCNGEKLGIGFEDELTGKLTFNIGVIRYKGKDVKMEGNLRYPASMQKEEIWQALQNSCREAGYICMEREHLPPVYIQPDSPFVTRLMNVYRKISGDTESSAFTIGGATYARAIPNAVAFGPLFPYEEELAHEANECISIESLDKMTAVFAAGLRSLLELKS